MDEDEAALLAELRAISDRSAPSRFADEADDGASGGPSTTSRSFGGSDPPALAMKSPSRRSTPTNGRQSSRRSPSPAPRVPQQPPARAGRSPARRMSGSSAARTPPRRASRSPARAAQSPSRRAPSPSPKPPAKAPRSGSVSRRGSTSPAPSRSKQRQSAKPMPDSGDIDIVSPPRRKVSETNGGFKTDLPNTFNGDRGGSAEDAELLAELRAISNKSASASRFAGEEEQEQQDEIKVDEPPRRISSSARNSQRSSTPPWKRKKAVSASDPKKGKQVSDKTQPESGGFKSSLPNTFQGSRGGPADDAELLAELRAISDKSSATDRFGSEEDANDQGGESTTPGSGFKSDLPKTFQGDRGGDAEDAELLAELRAISSNSGAADRFASDDNDMTDNVKEEENKPVQRRATRDSTPPWKKKRPSQKKSTNKPQPTPPPAAASSKPPAPAPSEGGGFKTDLPNTFTGDRGGSAEDAELLAELRAISNKSASADRFADDDAMAEPESDVIVHAPPPPRTRDSTPPWKKNRGSASRSGSQKKNTKKSQPAPPPAAAESMSSATSQGGGFKTDLPNTFQGDRGGAAEDAELLAELRAISNKSASADRFAEDGEAGGNENPAPSSNFQDEMTRPNPKSRRDSTPPWKRKGSSSGKSNPKKSAPVEESEPPRDESAGYGIKSSLPNTFQGDRGGAAEDAELLAELRAISAGAGASRFSSDDDGPSTEAMPPRPSAKPAPKPKPPTSKPAAPSTAPSPPQAMQNDLGAPTPASEVVTEANLGPSLTSRDWKVRVQSYELLQQLLTKKLERNNNTRGKIDAGSILDGLDSSVAAMAEDTNVGALDKALAFLFLYADACKKAGDAEQAASIVRSLVKKNGLSSRPSTLKLANDLVLKLIEVGVNGSESAHAVVEVLISEGLKSKKPKVVLASASLIQSAGSEFGVAVLPLHLVEQAIPVILSNSNAKVRETGLNILADLCRAMSKNSFEKILDQMKKAQVTELDALLQKQPEPTPPTKQLRSAAKSSGASGEGGAPAPATVSSAELEAQRFAARPAVNLISVLPKTEYYERIENKKWSEKVEALKAVLDAGGEKPYKLVQPSGSVSYSSLIGEMKQLLSHTHFAVVSKAMEVLAMLAEGVGEKLFSQLRPVLPTLLKLSKDKKLTRAVSSTLDAFFGNVLSFDHILDQDDAIPSSVNEKEEKSIIVRKEALGFLLRCINRNAKAGPRSNFTSRSVNSILSLAKGKLDDSDAAVRKEAVTIFQVLEALGDERFASQVEQSIASLQSTHARVHKTLASSSQAKAKPASKTTIDTPKAETPRAKSRIAGGARAESRSASRAESRSTPRAASRARPAVKKAAPPAPKGGSNGAGPPPKSSKDLEMPQQPDIDEAMHHLDRLRIPEWDLGEDDGGVYAGLCSSKWTLKNDAIKKMTSFVVSGEAANTCDDVTKNTESLMVVIHSFTKGFKESNVNLMKSIFQLFIEVCVYNERSEVQLSSWVMVEAVNSALNKIQDKKLADLCSKLMTSLCVVSVPMDVLLRATVAIEKAKSPIAHEMMLKWFNTFCKDFGARGMGQGVADVVPWLIEESGSTNPKVKKELNSVLSELHKQLGPTFQALVLQLSRGYNNEMMLQVFESSKYDPSEANVKRPKRSIVGMGDAEGREGELVLDVPKTDLQATLPSGIVSRMNSKEGKTAWKVRKESIEELSAALNNCNSLIDASSSQKIRFLTELARALRDRLTDTQTNLRPLAARTAGDFISKLDKSGKGRIGKILYPTLINSAINEIKKPMRDAAMTALRCGTTASSLEGSGPNKESLEALFTAFIDCFNEKALNAVGLGEFLSYLEENVEHLPNLAVSLSEKYAAVLVDCLTSSKSEIRGAALSLLEKSIENNIVSFSVCAQAVNKLKPAKQRTVAPMIANLENIGRASGEKENVPSAKDNAPASNEMENPSAPLPTRSKIPVQSREVKTNARAQSSRARPTQVPQPAQQPAASRHPLVSRTSKGTQPKHIAWPAFPEEPSASMLANLKKAWSGTLPAPSASKLFPQGGIKKQDDAQEGCELLESAIEMDSDGAAIEGQFDCILKWISYVLCCKEATVGLQAVLSLVQKLFAFLIQHQRELVEDEVGIIVPFLIEKTSNAKGRFRDTFMDIIGVLQEGALVSPKILGAVACIQVIERSHQARARALAFSVCRDCVEASGLAGIGKRGTLVAAKAYSTESLPETKAAALDLMEELVRKMNGDVGRLVKICGNSLSEQAASSIQERWKKSGGRKEHAVPPSPLRTRTESPMRSRSRYESPSRASSRINESPLRSRQLSPPRRAPSRMKSGGMSSVAATPDRPTSALAEGTPGSERSLSAELPALSLRDRMQNLNEQRHRISATTSPSDSRTPFPDSIPTSSSQDSSGKGAIPTTQDSGSALGTAASLRARLLKIKEKNRASESDSADAVTVAESAAGLKEFDDITAISTDGDPKEEFKRVMSHVKALLRRPVPLENDDPDINTTTRSLKKVHTALAHNVERTDGGPSLKAVVVENLGGLISQLMSVISFSLNCQEPSHNAGISIPLLSVSLATLMALFRFPEVASNVGVDDLTSLIRGTATILLDPRFSASSDLDDATCAQMAKAINKTAVNAATGAPRNTSIQALLAVQRQLSVELSTDFNGRLSRVISRLFTRVLKAEEQAPSAYSGAQMQTIVISMEDTLQACKDIESSAPCKEMVTNLLKSILSVHKRAEPLREIMKSLGISVSDSALAVILNSLAPAPVEERAAPPRSLSPTRLERSIADLVDALGNSREGPERDAALAALRKHQDVHGKEGLQEYLQEVSPAFRTFIEEQLATGAASPSNSDTSSSMSERLKKLRSRLAKSSELTIQTSLDEVDQPPPRARNLVAPTSSAPGTSNSTRSLSRLAQPSPSKARASSSRSRLAQPSPSRKSSLQGSSTRTTAAANLRARLEAVKSSKN